MSKPHSILSTTFILLSLFNLEKAKACEDKRLDLDPKVLQRVPVWQQNKLMACPAYAATQLADAYRFSHGDTDFDHLTSPLETAAGSTDYLASGGSIEESLDYISWKGSCDAKSISDHIKSTKGIEFVEALDQIYSHSNGSKKKLFAASEFGENKNMGKGKGKGNQSDSSGIDLSSFTTSQSISFAADWTSESKKQVKLELTEKQKRSVDETICYLQKIGIEEDLLPVKTAIEEWILRDRKSFISNVIKHLCTNRKKIDIPRPEVIYASPENNEKQQKDIFKKSINDRLSVNTPVGIQFCSEVVTDGKHLASFDSNGFFNCKNDGGHAAVIVGSKKNIFGQCEYLVRDSYCTEYSKKKSLANPLNLVPKEQQTDICNDGQYWISADSLVGNTQALIYLK